MSPSGAPARQLSRPKIDRLRIRHLRLLELMAQAGSVTKAAAALGISQPAASRLLQELEAAFGLAMFDRTAGGTTLSGHGERAVARLKAVLGLLDATREDLDPNAEAPCVRIGILRVAGIALIPGMVAQLRAQGAMPRIRLYKSAASGLLTLLKDGAVDCVIGRFETDRSPCPVDTLDILPLTNERYEIACSPGHPLAGRAPACAAELRAYPWIVPLAHSHTRRAFERMFASQGIPPPVPDIESSSFHETAAILFHNPAAYLTMAPRSAIAYYERLGRLRRVELQQPFPDDHLVFMTLRHMAEGSPLGRIRQALLQAAAHAEP